MLNLEAFVTNLGRLINGSHFHSDCKLEVSDSQTKYYLKLSVNDKDYNLYRFDLDGGELNIFAIKDLPFLGINEYLLTQVKLKDMLEGDTINNNVLTFIVKVIMTHYALVKAGNPTHLVFSTPTSFSFKPEEVGSEILTSMANSVLRNVTNSTLCDSVLPNSFWINVGNNNGVLLHQVYDDVVVLVFNIGYDGMTGSTCYKYVYRGVCDANDIFSLNEMVTTICNICC